MLNTDAHNPHVQHKMSQEEFIENTLSIEASKGINENYLKELYTRVIEDEIKLNTEDLIFPRVVKQGRLKYLRPKFYTKKVLWFVLTENTLLAFKKPGDTEIVDTITLENTIIFKNKKDGKFQFLLKQSRQSLREAVPTPRINTNDTANIITFECNSEYELDHWVKWLSKNMAQMHGKPQGTIEKSISTPSVPLSIAAT